MLPIFRWRKSCEAKPHPQVVYFFNQAFQPDMQMKCLQNFGIFSLMMLNDHFNLSKTPTMHNKSCLWMDCLCLEDRAQCLGFLLLLENREIVQYIKYWGLNHFSGSYASAMAGAAAGGEQNKAQPSNSSQRNRNSKCNNFTSMLKSVLTWSA